VTDTEPFALTIVLVAAIGLVVVLSSRLSSSLKVPTPALVLVGSAIAVKVVPQLHAPAELSVDKLVTVALACLLFDGGMGIGRHRFASAARSIIVVGVVGTFLTAAAAALLVHVAFGFGWYVSLLLATAIAPTDPAVVFSVLGRQQVTGPAGTILEGESGANDPVGIALMASLVEAHGLSGTAFLHVAADFLEQMAVGAAIGIVGGRALLWFMRAVPLPGEGLYPLRTLASAFVLFGVATLAHGSGFLAVFVAGIMLGDERAPYKREIERFHAALASLAEIVAFVVLGLTVHLDELAHANVWIPGLILGVSVAIVVRPILVGLCLLPAHLPRAQRDFVLLTGLKGAVPILLGGYLLSAHVSGAQRLYGIVVVVVVFSVAVHASVVPGIARLLTLPMQPIELEPWALGVRLRNEPAGVARVVVAKGSSADGCCVDELTELPPHAWITLLVRDGQLMAVRGSTRLMAGDELTLLTDGDDTATLTALFETARPTPPGENATGQH